MVWILLTKHLGYFVSSLSSVDKSNFRLLKGQHGAQPTEKKAQGEENFPLYTFLTGPQETWIHKKHG